MERLKGQFRLVYYLVFFLVIFLLLPMDVRAQTPQGYEALDSRAYQVLEDWEARGLIGVMPALRPYRRYDIYRAVLEVAAKDSLLTDYDRHWVRLLTSRMNLSYDGKKQLKKLRYNLNWNEGVTLFDKANNSYNITPLLTIKTGIENGAYQPSTSIGIDLRVNLFQRVSIDFRRTAEWIQSEYFPLWKDFSPTAMREDPNLLTRPERNLASFANEVYGLNANFKWISFSLGKSAFKFGEAENGQIILSNKSTSMLNVRLDIHPTPWLYFIYIHGELASLERSDAKFPTSDPNVLSASSEMRSKYFVHHSLTFRPFKKVQFTIGENVVYSDKLQLRYMMPFTVYRTYVNDESVGLGFETIDNPNTQVFATLSLKNLIPRVSLYGEFLVDEVLFDENLFSDGHRNQVAYTFGMKAHNYLFSRSVLTIEFTRIFPFVYRNINPAQTYENSGFPIGHWLQDDADILYASYIKSFGMRWRLRLWGQYVRKGYSGTFKDQYDQGFIRPFYFLHNGVKNYYTEAGLTVWYNLKHIVQFHGGYVWKQHTGENALGDVHLFWVGVHLGL